MILHKKIGDVIWTPAIYIKRNVGRKRKHSRDIPIWAFSLNRPLIGCLMDVYSNSSASIHLLFISTNLCDCVIK